MDFLKQYGGYMAIGLLVASIVYGGYSYLGGGSEPAAPLVSRTGGTVAPAVGGDLLTTLLSLHSLSLDPTVFGDPVFRNLKDFGIPIPAEAVGRSNPFAPLGENARAASTPSTP
ncbi:hypothetical protein K8Q93_01715 [Candidatus Parcubacteria bacterium]|nr:hypothetical protein [Candidatus Parcubacteria bacterium]